MQDVVTEDTTKEKENTSVSELDFSELFREHYPRVYNYLRYRVIEPEDAEDLISVVFEKAYTNREQFDSSRGAFSTWLFRIAHNTLANYYRTRQRRSAWEYEGELPDDVTLSEPSPETQIIRQEAVAQLLQGLAQLGERDQEVISLKFAGRLNNRQIGQIMDLKEKTVSVVLLRAMRRLQQEVRELAL